MNDVDSLIETLESLDLRYADFIVAGSAPLLVHGLRSSIQDVDIVARGPEWDKVEARYEVTRAPYEEVLVAHFFHRGVSIEILNGWFPVTLGWDVDHLIKKADVVRGVNFLPLDLTLVWKKALGRDKDLDDIRELEAFLHAGNGRP
ncbi:hypothetical protein BZB76_5885 [Actinomadura pelletieri DSM 43383]|uniref:Nucleotidyltransferase-like protein n=1 Tax=Actinomadura pelletieri DSM 43383 TaxID=1120940 RepID=A0A495QB01_9ACTN|nr:hypothetical protein BZB76_5885 [Actinomadura pelletieri DSM 43383]